MTDEQKPFKRERRYLIVKLSDLADCLPQPQIDHLKSLAEEVDSGRTMRGKRPLNCVVVEDDWPEYETVWKMIEDRVTGCASAPAESEPVATDVLYEYYLQAVDDARRSYTSYKASVRGQQLSPLDDPQYHLFVEAYRLFHTPASPAQPPNAQPPNVQAQIDALKAELAEAKKDATSTDGSLTLEDAINGVLDLFPSADKQALRVLGELLTKPETRTTNEHS